MAIAGGTRTKRWTAAEVERLVELGVVDHPERYVLLHGELREKMGQKNLHIAGVRRGVRALQAVFGAGYVVDQQLPLKGMPDSEPEPDLCVKRGTVEAFDRRPALPEEVALVVEVADTSLAEDRGEMAALYARFGVPEYWIVNLRDRTLEVRRGPLGDVWRETVIHAESESVAPLDAPAFPIPVATLLPPRDEEDAVPLPA